MAFVTPVVEHWLEREIAQWVHPMKDRSNDPVKWMKGKEPQGLCYLTTQLELINLVNLSYGMPDIVGHIFFFGIN